MGFFQLGDNGFVAGIPGLVLGADFHNLDAGEQTDVIEKGTIRADGIRDGNIIGNAKFPVIGAMSRGDMGNYLGLVVETVSRVLTRLQNNGVLKIQGREVEILEPQTLADLAGTHWQAP